MPTECEVTNKRYNWAAPGDVNAFFGLMLDNIADLLLAVGLLHEVFAFPTEFALRRMVPGTAIGVLVGDLLFFWMALTVARRTGRNNITAMPLGLDTPSTFGMVFFVLGPSFLHAQNQLGLSIDEAARYTWHIGTCAIFVSGLFKLACAAGAHWVRHRLPRAGLLGSLAAVALVLISFLPLLEICQMPVVGLTALAIILTTLVARVRLPFRIPGALGALLIAGGLYYLMRATGMLTHVAELPFDPRQGLLPYEWLEVFQLRWLARMPDALNYLPIVIPFALATVVGGIDCTESAAAAGDDFDTRQVIGVEAVATLAAGLCGGVIQTTPYIGHPAYKAMGGRAAYTLATALFVGGAGLLGYFGYLYWLIPKPTVFPILVFIGLEITAQSFRATPQKHYPAVALACVPALAALALLYADNLLGDPAMFAAGITLEKLQPELREQILVTRILANGFIVTSLIWASALAALIDRRLQIAAAFFLMAAGLSIFGIIHSPLPGGRLFLPWQLPEADLQYPLRFASGYLVVAALLFCWGAWQNKVETHLPTSEEASA